MLPIIDKGNKIMLFAYKLFINWSNNLLTMYLIYI